MTTPTPADMPATRVAGAKKTKPAEAAATETADAYTPEQLARDTALRTARAVMQSRSPFGSSSMSWNPIDLIAIAQWILTGTPPLVDEDAAAAKQKARRSVGSSAS